MSLARCLLSSPGILHKGDGTNIYLKEKPKTLVNILGNGERRKLNCDGCNGPAQDNRLLAPVALASGLDGSLYLGDYNFIRKLSPDREEIASILEMRCVIFVLGGFVGSVGQRMDCGIQF